MPEELLVFSIDWIDWFWHLAVAYGKKELSHTHLFLVGMPQNSTSNLTFTDMKAEELHDLCIEDYNLKPVAWLALLYPHGLDNSFQNCKNWISCD